MRKNFTQLIGGLFQSKKYVVALTSLMILAGSVYLMAAIQPITVQPIIVPADKAVNGPVADRAFTALNDIVITEGDAKDFRSGSFTLTAPSGWQFNPTGSITAIPNSSNVTIGTITRNATLIVVNFTIINANQNGFDQITIRGVEVQALNGNLLTSNSDVVLSSSINGIGLPASVARLSQVHGAARKLAFSQQPSTAGVYSTISPAVTVLVQDFFGHTVTGGASASSDITLAIGANSGGGVLAGNRTVAANNGLATFSNLSIDASGNNYTLVASSGTLTSATSSTFSITSTTPVLNEVVTAGCYTIGAPEQTITLRGSNFARNSVGRVGNSNRPTTYVSPNELRMTLLASDMAVAGNKDINVLNLNPTAVSAIHTVVVHHTIQTAPITNSTRSPECTGGGRTYTAPADFTGYEWSVSEGATMTSATATSNVFSIRFDDVAPASGKVTVTVKATNPCGVAGTRSFDILVNQTPPDVITYNTPTTFCEGGFVVLKAPVAASGEPAYGYQWLLNGAAIPNATDPTYKAEVAGAYRVTVRAADPNICSNTSTTVNVYITSPLTQDDITGVTSYCHRAPVTAATALTATIAGGVTNAGGTPARAYQWQQSSSASGPWTNATGATSTAANYLPSTAETGTVYYRRIVSAGGCENASAPVAVTVKPNPVVEVEANKTAICQGETVELTASGADSYIWSGTGMPAGATSDKITVTPTATTTYTVVGVTDGCQSAPQTVTITVTPNLIQGAITGVTQYCQIAGGFGTPLSSTVSGGVAAKSYLWEQSLNGNSDWEPAENTNNGASYTPSISEAGTIYYRRVVESGSCTIISGAVAVVVTPAIINNISSADQVVCANEAIATLTGTVSGGNPGDVSYQWEQSPTGTGNWTNAPGASTAINYTPAAEPTIATSKTTYYRRKVISGNCTSLSEPVSVRIVAMPVAEITDGPNDYFCPPASATLTARTGAGYRYTWFRVVPDGEDEQVGTDQNTYTTDVEGSYYVVVRGENNCTSTSAPTQVKSTIMHTNIISGAQTICYNAAPATLEGEKSTSDLGIVTYQWQFSDDGTNFSNIPNTNVQNLDLTTRLTADRWYRRVARVGSGCSITSDPVKVAVKPLLRVTNLPGTAPAICNNTAYTFTPEGSEGSKTISWARAKVAGISNDATSGTGAINETLINTTAAAIDVTYVYTTSDDEGCTGPAQNLVVRVNPTPQLSSSLSPAAICGGTEFDYTASSATTGTTYAWVRKPSQGIITTAPEDGTGARVRHVLTNTTANPIDVTYTYTLTANGCSNSQDVVVRVNPRPQLSSTLSPDPICSGATFSYTPISATEGATYSWTRIAPASISGGATAGTGGVSQALTNNSTAPVQVTYRYTTTANGCAGTSTQDVVVTVNPSPKLSSPLTANVCSGATFNYAPTSATEGAAFSWTRAASGGNAASSGTSNISEVLTNTGTAPITVTYQITTSANNCVGEPQELVVTINPRPVLSSPLTATVCSGSAFTYTPSSTTTGATYTWTRAAVPGISNAAVTNGTGAVNETLVNTTANPVNVTYVYTTTANGCIGNTAQNVVVTVNPRPQLSSTLSPAAICSGATFSYTPTSATDNATYSWTRIAPASISGGATAGTGGVSQALTNNSTAPVQVTYRYTTTANGCAGTSTQDVVVTVNPSPKLSSSLAMSVCSGTPLSYTPASNTLGTTFTWERLPAIGITSDGPVSGSGPINQTLTNTTSSFVNVTYRITSSANGCTGLTEDVTVRVNPKPVATFAAKIGTAEVGSIIYSDGGNVTFTPTGATGGAFSVVSPSGLQGFTTSGSTATLNPCTALGEDASRQVTIRYTVSQGSSINTCSNFEEITYTLQRSNYTVIILADPYPTCRGQITEYTAYVYKDVARIIYPYLADANGIAVDEKGNKLGDQVLPITNPDYPFPNKESMPKILYDNAWRYFQPKVEGGTLMPATNFNYQWTKNRTNFFGPNSPTIQNAGLSSLDYYAVEVTSKNSGCTQPITSKMTNRMYTSATVNYEIALTSDKTTICQGGGIILTADLNDAFSFWQDIKLTLYWMLDRNGTVSQLGQTVYTSGDKIQFPTTGPEGGFLDGDKVYVEFSSALDQYNNANKCARGFITEILTIRVNDLISVRGTPKTPVVCAGSTETFSVIPVFTGPAPLTYVWTVGNKTYTTSTPNLPVVAGSDFAPGTYPVRVVVSNVCESMPVDLGSLTIQAQPTAALALGAGEAAAKCVGAGNTTTFTLAGTTNYPPAWSIVNGPATVSSTGVVTVTGTGTVRVRLTSSNPSATGCTAATREIDLTVLPQPAAVASVEGNATQCSNTTSPATYTVRGIYTGTVANWTLPQGSAFEIVNQSASNGVATATVRATGTGTATITLNASNPAAGCTAASSAVTLVANPLPLARTVNNPSYCSLTNAQGAEIILDNPESGVTYELRSGSQSFGTFSGTDSKLSLGIRPAGEYTIVGINNSNNAGCINTSVGKVTVKDTREIDAAGDFESKWVGIRKWEVTALTETAIEVTIPEGVTFHWYVKEPDEEEFRFYGRTTDKTMLIENVDPLSDVYAEVFLTNGDCRRVVFLSTSIIPLPVELLYFKATKRGNDVAMEWATASEQDNKGFEVQVSTDAKNFRSLGFVESKVGTSSLKQVYTFVDKENGKYGTRYYRLKQMDLDGKFEYFSTKAVHFGEVTVNKVKAYPNPFQSEVELSIDAEEGGNMLITVTSATGQQLLQRTIKVEKGANIEKLQLDPNLPRGVYIISTRMGDLNSHFKLLKQ